MKKPFSFSTLNNSRLFLKKEKLLAKSETFQAQQHSARLMLVKIMGSTHTD